MALDRRWEEVQGFQLGKEWPCLDETTEVQMVTALTFKTAIEYRRGMLSLTDGTPEIAAVMQALNRELDCLADYAEQLTDSQAASAILNWVGIMILDAGKPLSGVASLKDPVSGKELDIAFEPYRKIAQELREARDLHFSAFFDMSAVFTQEFKAQTSSARAFAALLDRELATEQTSDGLFREMREYLNTMKEFVEAVSRDFREQTRVYEEFVKALEALIELRVAELGSAIEKELQRVELGEFRSIELKYAWLGAFLTTAPSVAGLAIDLALPVGKLPGIVTGLGIAFSAAEHALVSGKIEQRKDKEKGAHRSVTAFLLSHLVFPAIAVLIARMFVHTQLLVAVSKRQLTQPSGDGSVDSAADDHEETWEGQ